MTTSHWVRPHSFTSPDFSSDIVILGGGYAGLATAYWISEYRPDLKIIVLERGQVGGGASGRNAGFLTKGSAAFYKSLTEKWGFEKAKGLYQFAGESLRLVHQRILRSSPEIKFERTSSSTLFQDEETHLKFKTPSFDPGDFEFQWKSGDELTSGIKSKFFGALENSPEYKVNPMQLMETLKNKLINRKIQIIENVSGYKITEDGVNTEIHTIKTKQAVLAMNGYLPEFHGAFKNMITPRRAQMLAVELEEDLDSPFLYYDPPERVYWRRAQDKVLLIGGKRLLDEKEEQGTFEKLSPVIQDGLESYLKDRLKINYKVLHRWSGIMGFTEHELPVVTRVQAPLEAFMLGGFSGHGMGLGFKSAQEMAELVTGMKRESFFDSFKMMKIKL